MKKKIMTLISLALLLVAQTSCRENEFDTVDLTLPDDDSSYEEIEATYSYNHPCAMYNQADFDRVKAMLDAVTAPDAVTEEFNNLKNSTYTVIPYTPNPTTQIVRGDVTGTSASSENYTNAMRDAAAAYQMALLWKLTANDSYASNAVNILNQWADVCEEVTSNDANHMLAAGAQGYTFANAAEILQSYDGWSSSDQSDFKEWIVDVFASKNKDFLDNHQGTNNCSEHYWSNWDLVNMCSYLSIGILTEDDEMVNYVVNYFYNGAGNGCIDRLIRGTHTDPLGTGETLCQNQESGRDQGHAQMSMAVTANLCQMAYTLYQDNPSVSALDFFAAEDNAIMKMGEYVALFNVKEGTDDDTNDTGTYLISVANMPFTQYIYCTGCSCTDQSHGATHTTCSEDGRGEPRPGWEIIYNHYANVKGLTSGYTYSQKFAERIRPEGGAGEPDNRYGTNSGAFDQLGWSTLMMYRE
ncbi:MAG: alginate lyase family protein [Bacteroides sp.]|nr:alginate lyase family protein [Bacteroides sp.]